MKSSGIGGQAVMEGVMMKNHDKYAVAVRKPNKEIAVEVSEYVALTKRYPVLNLPIIRGIVAFAESMSIGIKTLTFSSSFFEEEEEQPKEKTKGQEKLTNFFLILFSVALAIGVFMVIPFFASEFLGSRIESQFLLTVIEAVIRIALFVGYVFAISRMNDIKRVFMYHGAEHKVINCIEHGYELTVANVKKASKQHKRCGTSFMFYIMFISILFFMFIRVDHALLRVVYRILLVPVIAGVSYEFIRFAGNNDFLLVRLISKPGLWLQELTTKEPDEDMIEVAIQSVEAVFDWKAYLAENFNNKKKSISRRNMEEVAATISTEDKSSELFDERLNELEQIIEDKEKKSDAFKQSGEIAASLEPGLEEEDDDEVLKALDRFFVKDGNNVNA